MIGHNSPSVEIHVRPFIPNSQSRQEIFAINQILQALNLSQECAPQRGYSEEMWAYVFSGCKQRGYISIVFHIRGNKGSGTSDVSILSNAKRDSNIMSFTCLIPILRRAHPKTWILVL